MTEATWNEMLDRPISRRTKFLQESFSMIESGEHYQDILAKTNEKKLILRFLRSPVELIPSEADLSRIGGAVLQKMTLEGEPRA